MNNVDIVVYLGPTLSIQEAKILLPDALYLPPIRCGDILHALRWNPKIVIIIDGLFEKTTAVWHKEILLALESGIAVYGASSMGALRACELSAFGMTGIGKIYKKYCTGELTDDDEVAVLHQPDTNNYKVMTDAMVNVRATLSSAFNKKIIDTELQTALLDLTKKTFYQQRDFKKICLESFNKETIENLINWINEGNYCDQKRLDAIECLMAAKTPCDQKTNNSIICSRSMYIKTLQRKIACKPYHTFKHCFPIQEKTAQVSRLLGKNYCIAKYLAHLSAIVYALAKQQFTITNKDPVFINQSIKICPEWKIKNDLSETEFYEFTDRQRYISKFYYENNSGITQEKIENNLHYLKFIINNSGFNEFYFSYLISVIIEECSKRELVPSDNTLLITMNKFTKEKKIDSKEKFTAWLTKNNLDHKDFIEIIKLYFYLDYFIAKNNAYAIEAMDENDSAWWLLHALYVTDCYVRAKELLHEKTAFDNAIYKIHEGIKQEGNRFIYTLDFDLGEQEFEAFIGELQQHHAANLSKTDITQLQ